MPGLEDARPPGAIEVWAGRETTLQSPSPPPQSVPRGALRALSWSTLGTTISVAFLAVRTLLLPRLLAPEEFGLFGLAWFAISLLSSFSDPALGRVALGLRFSGPAEERRFLDTLWTFNLVRSAVLTALLTAGAWPYAAALHQPRLGPLLAATTSTLLLGAWGSPGGVLLFRDFDQRTLALQRIATELLALAATALAALLWPTAWALVLGNVLGAFLGAAASYVGQPYRPRFAWDRAQLSRGLAQGRHLGVVAALTFVTTQVDNLLVGSALGAAELGRYQFAYRLGSLPIESLNQVVYAAAMPLYTRLREQGTGAVAGRLRLTLSAVAFLVCAGFLPALLLRDGLVVLLGGARWAAAAALLPPILLLSLLRAGTMQLGTVLSALERTDLDARGRTIEAIFFVPACAALVAAFGSQGAAWAGALTYLLAFTLRARSVISLLPGEGPGVLAAWGRPALAGLCCGALGLLAERWGAPPLVTAPVALASFVALALWLDPALPRELRALRSERREDPAAAGDVRT